MPPQSQFKKQPPGMSFLPWLVLAFSLSVTFIAWKQTMLLSDERASDDFELQAKEIGAGIVSRLNTYRQVLRGGRGLFAASKLVERDEWRTYVDSLGLQENYPGILGVGYAVVIPPDKLASHVASIRSEGFPGYAVHPEGKRDIYTSIVYLEPFSAMNQRAFGYDMWSEPVRREAMSRATDTGVAAMSGKVLLVQEAGKDVQSGFLIYLPIYRNGLPHNSVEERRKALIGWVYSPFRMDDLMRGILGEREQEFDIEIFDGKDMQDSSRMFDSFPRLAHARFTSIREIEVSGRTWTVEVASLPGFESKIDRGRQYATAAGGIAISLLLFMLSWLLVHGRNRALKLAAEMNRELIESEYRFRTLYEKVPAGVVSVDIDTGLIVQANPKFQAMTGYGEDDLKKMRPVDLTYPEDRQETVENLSKLGRGESEGFHIEKRFVRRDGSVFWADIIVSILRNEADKSVRTIAIVADIEERKRWEAALKASEQRLQEIIDLMPVSLYIKDESSKIMLMNRACEEQWGVSFSEVKGTDGSGFFPPEQVDRFVETGAEVFAGKVPVDFEEVFWNARLKMNRIVHVYRKPIYDEEGKPLYLIGIMTDVTEQKEKEEEISLAATVFDIIDEAILITDPENRILRVNPSFTAITGYRPDEAIGRNPHMLSSGKHDEAFYNALWGELGATGAWRGEMWNRRKSGEIYVEWLTIKTLKDDKGRVRHNVAVFTDITQRREDDERARHLAYYDILTDLPNRALFADRLQQSLSQARREGGKLAVLFIDLNKFKPINDAHGHDVGDMLLREVASRLTSCVRESDTVSRLGGDEFVVLLHQIEAFEDAENVASKVRTEIAKPFEISGLELSVSASVGVAVYPGHGETGEALMKHADEAMYAAKSAGGVAR